MPRDGSGIYTRPPGTNAVADTTIESTKYNANVADVETDLNAPRPIIAGGTGANNAIDAANNLGVVSVKAAQTYTDAEKTVACNNIAAAPFDALAYNGMQINGSMDVSQERGATAFALSNGGAHVVVDGWWMQYNHVPATAAVQAGQIAAGPTGLSNSIFMQSTVGGNIGSSANDIAHIFQNCEGYRVARLSWGAADAMPITVGFWVWPSITGTLSVSARNGTRSYVTDVALSVAGGWQYKTVTIPGDTAGTWAKNNALGITVGFSSRCGTNWQQAAGSWQAGNKFCSPTATNFFATSGNAIYITGVTILPGTQAPTAAQSPLIMRPYDQELQLARRYYYKMVTGNYVYAEFYGVTGTYFNWSQQHPVQMRAAPTGAIIGSWNTVNTGVPVIGAVSNEHVVLQSVVSVAGPARCYFQNVADGLSGLTMDARL